MANTYTKLLYHIVFSTKNRSPLIVANLKSELYKYIGGIVRRLGGVLLEIGGIEDHVHLVLRLNADMSVAAMVRKIKANSSKWVNEKKVRAERFEWQTGYGAFTVSSSQLETVRGYARGQEKHHRKMSFKQEFVAMLDRHGIEYDKRYLWG